MSNQDLHLSREEWVNACQFHTLTEGAVLREVRDRVNEVRRSAPEIFPTVVLDLDSTLYEVAPRTFAILREWADSKSIEFPRVADFIRRLSLEEIGYSIRDTLFAQQDSEDSEFCEAAESLRSFWSNKFFTSEYLVWDRPYPGTVKFVREIHEAGARIVYLTGRDRSKMEAGTLANLRRDGFPLEEGSTRLLMKEEPLDDVAYKSAAARRILEWGAVVASFENEPRNLIALSQCFPDAFHVFVDTVCSALPAPRANGLYRIKKFST
jgi:HAD superfamily, subfamily IIIB (Acid phosphatase)